MLMQWLAASEAPWFLNREIQDLQGEHLCGHALLAFERYDLLLEENWLKDHLGEKIDARKLKHLRRMDDPAMMPDLYALAVKAAERQVKL
jgi:hypothetical protein